MSVSGNMDFEDEDAYESSALRWLSLAFVFLAIMGFIALAWYAYQSGVEPISEEEIPLIEADAAPVKEQPEDPGGWKFEHQDKSVYNQLAAGDAAQEAPVVEQILPEPEAPMLWPGAEKEAVASAAVNAAEAEAKPAEATVAESAAEAVAVTESVVAEVEEAAPAAVEQVAEVPVAAVAVQEEKPAAQPVEQPVEKVEAVAEEKPVLASVSSSSGNFAVQLASLSNETDAEAAWARIEKAQSALLSGRTSRIQRADLGAKGVFYRLQITGLASDAEARSLCKKLEAAKQGCFVVKAQ